MIYVVGLTMIDTHAHIDFNAFEDDRDDVIKRAFENGLTAIIIPGVEPKDYGRLLDLSSRFDNIFCGMGVHPHNAKDANEEVYQTILENSKNENVKAIGEIGIDYYYDFAPKDLQQEVFRRQLQIAKQVDLPVIVHNREADDDILRIIDEEQNGNLKGVLHCFSSSVEVMEKAIDLGFHISFTGNITFKKSDLKEVVEKVPLDRIMLETDSPFMTPVPNRGKRNEPSNVRFVAEKISEIKSISINEVIEMTSRTAKNLFNLMILTLMFLMAFSISNSQTAKGVQPPVASTEEEEEEEFLYKKFIGAGLMIGTNTVVDSYESDDFDPSYEGLLSIGGAFFYSPFDYLVLEVGYNYSKNTKIAEKWDYTIEPFIYNTFEFSSHWVFNPYSRINFFGSLGLDYHMNSYDIRKLNQLGWNTGVGLFINFPTSFGLFNVIAEWRINFETVYRDQERQINGTTKTFKDKARSFYSIPRLYVVYYPPF
jgi:TatD DNase family protein